MSGRRPPPPDNDERRKLFRRMEWLYVWAPPLMILLIASSGSAVVAWIVQVDGTSFWQRWAVVFAFVTLAPLLAYLIRDRMSR